jgi:hypothetical protein
MTKPKKDVKFPHKDARRTSKSSNDSHDALDPSSPVAATKPEVSRTMSYDGAWTDDEKATTTASNSSKLAN